MSHNNEDDGDRGLSQWLLDGETAESPPWVDDDQKRSTAYRLRSRAGLITALIAPWMALVALTTLGSDETADAPPAAASPETRAAPPAGQQAAPTTGLLETSPNAKSAWSPPVEAATAGALGDVAPTAIRSVRDAVTVGDGPDTSALDVASAEPPTQLNDDTWLVRVHAVVLRGNRRHWTSASHEIWVVPVGRRENVTVAVDTPWRVSVAPHRPHHETWVRATIDPAAVRKALRAHDIDTGSDLEVQQHPDLPWLLRAVTPQGGVWLHSDGVVRVLGAVDAGADGGNDGQSP